MIFLQILICLAALYVFLMHPRIRRADSSPFLGTFFAHRGLHDNNRQIPENSLADVYKRQVFIIPSKLNTEILFRIFSTSIPNLSG